MDSELSNVSQETQRQYQMVEGISQKRFLDKATQTDEIKYVKVWKINFGSLIFLFLGIIISFVIYVDIQGKLNIQQQQLEQKRKGCILDYEKQKCFLQLPAQKIFCRELELCINVDWELQRGIELSGIIADNINNFIDRINLRTYLLLIIPFMALSLGIIKMIFK
ncbi:unnamed protein product [Paramecium sonneborni]|uniref:Brl1/Brr6 domain-containing protein n=1 Tax=Paramecium sonneborni TaxID=65129 RepID=A0A8S1LGR5_9CILI|nr:unnamed protein product [Paramecium sonneborni]